MRFAFDEDTLQLRDAVRDALATACPPAAVRRAWSEPDTAVRGVLAELGVFGLNAPPEVGGMGLGATGWVLVAEEAGRAAAPVPLIEILALNPTLAALGEHALLEAVVRGEATATVAAEGGFALEADRAAAVFEVGDHVWRRFTPTLEAERSVDGSRRLFRVSGDRVRTDADAAALRDRLSLAAAATLLGLSRWMLDTGVAYAKARRQFGKPIGSFQAVQHRLVDALSRIAFAAPAVYRAAWSLDAAHPDRSVHVAMAKLAASEAATSTARQVLQVHGAIGYAFEHDLHLWMKRAWALSAAWGGPGAALERISDHVLSGGVHG